ncbi:hypothetical protein [Mesorhizobium loti]|uniref:hypothetical protein n=1 Tax=Rhizobium loti TaxID=381 RepID=UPI0012BC9C7F|nr:hypothetical protein [Mesorhizobium loti]
MTHLEMVRPRKMPPSKENGDPKAVTDLTTIANAEMGGEFAPRLRERRLTDKYEFHSQVLNLSV